MFQNSNQPWHVSSGEVLQGWLLLSVSVIVYATLSTSMTLHGFDEAKSILVPFGLVGAAATAVLVAWKTRMPRQAEAFERSSGARLSSQGETASPTGNSELLELWREAKAAEMDKVMLSGLESLPPRERTVVSLCYMEGLSAEEIAHVLEISASDVKLELRNALERLREQLRSEHLRTASVSMPPRDDQGSPEAAVSPVWRLHERLTYLQEAIKSGASR